MRINLATNADVADYWANQRQAEGKGSNFFFDKDKLFSYTSASCIARIVAPGAVAISTLRQTSKKDISTRLHIRLAERAAVHMKQVYCYRPNNDVYVNRAAVVNQIKEALDDAALPRIRQPRRDASNERAEHFAKQFNDFLAVLPANERGDVQPFPETAQELRDYFVVQHVMQRLES